MSTNNTLAQARSRAATPDGFSMICAYDEIVELDALKPNPRKPNKHPDAQIELLAKIIQGQGWQAPITVSRRSGLIVRGHARLEAGHKTGGKYAPVEYQEYESDSAEMSDLIADNRIAELAVMDEKSILELLQELDANTDGVNPEMTGFSADTIREMLEKAVAGADTDAEKAAARLTLQQKFLVSPFTVLDARGGFWMERKKAWEALGIHSEVGRGADGDKTRSGLIYSRSRQPPAVYAAKNDYEAKIGRKISWDEFTDLFPDVMSQGGTSIFDPVLCEIAYRWFCPQSGSIIDPFAGGSVRGIVAALTGRRYTGVDLSGRQIEANISNWEEITHESVLAESEDAYIVTPPIWINGDSARIKELAPGQYDLLFTCPPYADLEVYSNKPEDLSNKDYPEFLSLYRKIIAQTSSMLKPDRFACIVIGDIRDNRGFYRNFISDTIAAFQDAGLKLYNEAILITQFGSLPIRVGKQFTNSRKLGKAHQNVLIFCNGDPAQSAVFRQEDPEAEAQDIAAFLQEKTGNWPRRTRRFSFSQRAARRPPRTLSAPRRVQETWIQQTMPLFCGNSLESPTERRNNAITMRGIRIPHASLFRKEKPAMSKKRRLTEPDAELWERMEGESVKNYERFCAYRDMRYKPPRTGEDGRIPDGALPKPEIGKERSIRALARKLGVSRQGIEVMSSRFRWVERCGAYDLYILRRMREKGEADIIKMHETHALIAANMLKKAVGRLMPLRDMDISAADLVRLVDIGVKIERLSRGESTERQEIGGEAKIQHSHTGAISVAQTNSIDLSSFPDKELGSLEQLLGKLHPEPGV